MRTIPKKNEPRVYRRTLDQVKNALAGLLGWYPKDVTYSKVYKFHMSGAYDNEDNGQEIYQLIEEFLSKDKNEVYDETGKPDLK